MVRYQCNVNVNKFAHRGSMFVAELAINNSVDNV